MSISGQTGSGDTETQLDPDIKKRYLSAADTVTSLAKGLNPSEVPQLKVAGVDPLQAMGSTYLTSHLGQGDQAMNQAEELAYKAGHYNPSQVTAPTMNAAKIPDLAKAQSFRADAANLGKADSYDPATLGKANTYDPATLGRANTYDAALIDQDKVGQVDPKSLKDISLKGYMDPYEDQVAGGLISDMERARQIQQQHDKASAINAHAFGGSREAVADSLTNDDYFNRLSQSLAQLRSQGFSQATGLAESDLDRALQGQTTNVGTNLQIQQDNQAAKTGAREFGATAQNAVDQLDAAAKNAAREFGASANNQNDQLDAAAKNAAREFGATSNNTFALQDAANKQDISKFNAGQATDISQYNTGQVNTGKLTGAEYQQAANAANAAAKLAAAQGNQNAGLTANAQQVGAASTLGNLGAADQQMALAGTQALDAQGNLIRGITQDQNEAAYQNAQAKYGQQFDQAKMLLAPFNALPTLSSGGSSSSTSSGAGFGK